MNSARGVDSPGSRSKELVYTEVNVSYNGLHYPGPVGPEVDAKEYIVRTWASKGVVAVAELWSEYNVARVRGHCAHDRYYTTAKARANNSSTRSVASQTPVSAETHADPAES